MDRLPERPEWPWRYSAFEVRQSKSLGGSARLELDPRTTVLVGKNGAGKSALMEAIFSGARAATGMMRKDRLDPIGFACEIYSLMMVDIPIRYECCWSLEKSTGSLASPMLRRAAKTDADFAAIEESCRMMNPDNYLWRLKDGHLLRNDGSVADVPVSRGLLNWWNASHDNKFAFNTMVEPLVDMLLWKVWFVGADIPRGGSRREQVALPYPWPASSGPKLEKFYGHIALAVRRLAMRIAGWHEDGSDELHSFVDIGRRLGILRSVDIALAPNPKRPPRIRTPEQVAEITVDGVNLGLLSDGTLRAMTVLVALVDPKISLVLIEEPEIALHPGLVARLLAEIDTSSEDRQFIVSTQSPQVVSWARPEAIRLVERREGATHVRPLSPQQVAMLSRYLRDEGSLGDYIFGGGVDRE